MKTDLDKLMADAGFDVLVVQGPAQGNFALSYLGNGAKVTHGIIVKKQGEAPVFVVGGMERDEAAKSGLEVIVDTAFNYLEHYRETEDPLEAQVLMYRDMFEHFGISGTVSFYGVGSPGASYLFLKTLEERLPGITVAGETGTTILDKATITKGEGELAALTSVAQRTNAVVAEAVEFMKGHGAKEGMLVKGDGTPLTVGDVKREIRARLLYYGLEESEEMIFAIGRDAGVPHSRGEDTDPLYLGKAIVFDLFPRDPITGYYHDMTRTYSLGYAEEAVQRAYEQVMQAFNAVMDALEVGESGGRYQRMTCEIFEEHGHPTPNSHPGTQEGYVHSLGHGIGLRLHEFPRLSDRVDDKLEAGQVFTVEPGLYYPEQGYGIRVEDTVYIDSEGAFHSLTPAPKDLVIPIEGS